MIFNKMELHFDKQSVGNKFYIFCFYPTKIYGSKLYVIIGLHA